MEREKIIEKIARIICENGTVDCFCPEPQRVACTSYNKARDILNELIHDGAVVLTREEYTELKQRPEKVHDEMDERMKEELAIEKRMGEKKAEQARTETAREILHTLWGWLNRKSLFKDDILELAEKYGVEAEE